jgi:hypothetical protein
MPIRQRERSVKTFLAAAAIRAVRTVAQTAVATTSSSAVFLEDVVILPVVSASLLAGILSLVTSAATSLPEVDRDGAR